MFKKFINHLRDKNPTKPAVDAVVQAMLDRPDDFRINNNTMEDTKTDYTYWLGYESGIYSPYSLKFKGYQARRFKSMVRNLKIYQHEKKLKGIRAT